MNKSYFWKNWSWMVVALVAAVAGCGKSQPPEPAAPVDVEAARQAEEAQHAAEAAHRAEP